MCRVLALLFILGVITQGSNHAALAQQQCGDSVDVLIVGAGMAGVSAATTLQAEAPDVTFKIVESTDRVGGRVSTVDFEGIQVEEGAGWAFDDRTGRNDVFRLLQVYGISQQDFNFEDLSVLKKTSTGVQDVTAEYDAALAQYTAASDCLSGYIDETLYNSMTADDPVDVGYSAGLADPAPRPDCPDVFQATTPVEQIVEWNFIDYEHAASTSSYYSYPDSEGVGRLLPAVTGGYENLPIRHAEALFGNSGLSEIDFNTKVTMIDYEDTTDANYPVRTTVTSDSGCTYYLSKYIILTVSTGVLESNAIAFNPPLAYDTNPYSFEVYQRVFFKFGGVVGGSYDKHLLMTYDEEEGYTEAGHHWENMRIAGKGDGSLWYCTIVTDALQQLSSQNTNGETLSPEQIDTILDKLRFAFPADATHMMDGNYQYFVPDMVNRESFGYGSFGTLRPGTTLSDDFYPFYGGGIPQKYCEHNGCDAAGKWRLHISGSASCYEYYELVDGALYAGERSARYVLFDMGIIEDYDTAQLEVCDDIGFLEDIFDNEGGVDEDGDGLCPDDLFILLLPFCLLLEFALNFFQSEFG